MAPPMRPLAANSHFCCRGRRSQTMMAMTMLRKTAYWAMSEMSLSIPDPVAAKSEKAGACARHGQQRSPERLCVPAYTGCPNRTLTSC